MYHRNFDPWKDNRLSNYLGIVDIQFSFSSKINFFLVNVYYFGSHAYKVAEFLL